MAGAKHTPGPWEVCNTVDIYPVDDHKARFHIADCDPDGAPLEKGEVGSLTDITYAEACANARLIAAAPDMREATERLLALVEDHERAIRLLGGEVVDAHNDKDFARAAISKAEGHTDA